MRGEGEGGVRWSSYISERRSGDSGRGEMRW